MLSECVCVGEERRSEMVMGGWSYRVKGSSIRFWLVGFDFVVAVCGCFCSREEDGQRRKEEVD